jgi:His/Glu/Gln/Arg/opine family amino acid ABC transporter permease subunit
MPGLDFAPIVERLPQFGAGALQTTWLAAASFSLAIVVGLGLALARLSRRRWLSWSSRVVTDFLRGTPALVQVLLIYFGLPQVGVSLDAAAAGIIALGLNSGAYLGEIMRSGIVSVDPGQTEAARSIGMSHAQAMRRVVLPQALRIALPPVTNEATTLVKGTSLLSVISITELTRVGQQVMGITFRPIEAFLAVALVYLVMIVALSQASTALERWLSFPK